MKLLIVTLMAVLLASTIDAQDTTAEIEKIFKWATPESPGCVCAVSHNSQVVVNRAFGSADLERNVLLNTNSIFDAGSLTKQFVAAATLLLVEEKKLSLSDDIRKYIKELPDYGHTITIDHLLTHTSGLRDWTGIKSLAAGDDNVLKLILRQHSLNFNPGEEWSYSNSGFVLMKEIIARVSGMTFAEFTRTRLFEPLNMKMTNYREDMREVINNRALAYNKTGGRWKMAMLLDNERGGGGIFSTASDLLIWNDALTNKRLGVFVSEKIQEAARLNNGRKLSYARGLFLDLTDRGTAFFWHSGSADGYKSLLARFPDEQLSIAIMCNSGDNTERIEFGRRIFDLFVPKTSAAKSSADSPVATRKIDTSGIDLNSKAGLFFNDTNGDQLRLIVANGNLRIANGPLLIAEAKDRFINAAANLNFMSDDKFELQFITGDQIVLKSMEGKRSEFRRAQPNSFKAEDLKKFTGQYGSDEIGSVLVIESKGENLVIHFEHTPERSLEFKSVDGDCFGWGRITLRFKRDKAGRIVAFDFSNPVLRNVRFTRTEYQASR